MRKIIGTAGATLAIAATMALSAAPAGAQTAIEYALMSGVTASGDGEPAGARAATGGGGIEFWKDDSKKEVVDSYSPR
jgi:hypothetical protein